MVREVIVAIVAAHPDEGLEGRVQEDKGAVLQEQGAGPQEYDKNVAERYGIGRKGQEKRAEKEESPEPREDAESKARATYEHGVRESVVAELLYNTLRIDFPPSARAHQQREFYSWQQGPMGFVLYEIEQARMMN